MKTKLDSTVSLGRRLYVIDHAMITVDQEIIYPLQAGQRLRKSQWV